VTVKEKIFTGIKILQICRSKLLENLEKSYGRTMDANLSDGKSVHGLWPVELTNK
jgi:hypothetical protein